MSGLGRKLSGSPEDPAVLFLHGFMGSSTDWRDVLAAIEDRAFCIALDLPGHGASLGLTPEAYTMEGSAQAVIRTLDEHEVERAVIVGYSMGGRLALYLALRHPGRCRALVLESASPGLESPDERAARRVADEEKASRLEREGLEAFLHDWYRQPLFASLAGDERLLRKTVESRLCNDSAELARSLRGMGVGNMPSLWGDLQDLAVPALMLVGERDEKYVGIARRVSERSECVEVGVVQGSGHNAHAEAPEAYVRSLQRFLGRL
jgi:2-succinyl-6-hydroxy-2,4-cyclohexadiene-1-carboxylate synthase